MYIFDTNSISQLGNYYPGTFPSFWAEFNTLVDDRHILSVKEVYNELTRHTRVSHITDWRENNRKIFLPPTAEETEFVGEIFRTDNFSALIPIEKRLKGEFVADPFVIASAMTKGHCVVSEETLRGTAIKVPFVCNHFGVQCINLETLMNRHGWKF